MRIQGWECTVNHDGTVRTAKHTTEGVVAWINGRIIANGDVRIEVWPELPATTWTAPSFGARPVDGLV